MQQEVKQIIDEHFKDNYAYYLRICKKYCQGRYIADDMAQELYLSFFNVKPAVIIQFNSVGKLKNIGGKLMLSLFNKRNNGTKNAGKTTSPLHEIPQKDFLNQKGYRSEHPEDDACRGVDHVEYSKEERMAAIVWEADGGLDMYVKERALVKEAQIGKMQAAITELMRKPDTWFDVSVFMECQQQSILSLSKRTKISRSYLTRAYNKGQELLKNEINK